MYELGEGVFLSLGRVEEEPVLHQGRVIGVHHETLVGEFIDPIALAVGSEVILHATRDGKFYQQKMRVAALRQTEPTLVAALVKTGEPEPMEQRLSARVLTVALEIRARIAADTWQVVDVSRHGFAVLTRRVLERGTLVDVALWGEGLACAGRARVATVRCMEDGLMRYGLVPATEDTAFGDALADVALRVEAIQCRRLSRIG